MKKLQLKKFGKDKWSRMVYGDKDGNLFKDVSCGMGEPVFCTSYGGFDGEPDTPLEYIKKYKDMEVEIVSEFPKEDEQVSEKDVEKLEDERNRFLTIAYNAIVEGGIEERMDRERILIELSCSEDEYNEIME